MATGFYKQIALSWDLDPNPFITGWKVQRADDAGFTSNVVTLTQARALSFVDSGLPDSTTRYYKVAAANDRDQLTSGFSAVVSATTLADNSTVLAQLTAGVLSLQRAHIRDAVIDTAKITDAAIVTAKIANLAVTAAKIANLAVGSAQIDDLAVTTAKIANLAVTSAKVNDLSADKITAGTITALVKIAANQIELDGVNNVINIKDTQGSPAVRVKVGKLGVGSTDYGIQLYDSSGSLMWDALNSGVQSIGIKDLAVISAKLNDLAVLTGKIANNAVTANSAYGSGALGYSNATTSYTDTGASVTLTTTGAPVMVCGVGNALTEWTAGGAGLHRIVGAWKLVRDSTDLREFGHADNVDGVVGAPNIIGPASFFYVDTPSAGSHTYKVQGKVGTASSKITIDRMDMIALELKK